MKKNILVSRAFLPSGISCTSSSTNDELGAQIRTDSDDEPGTQARTDTTDEPETQVRTDTDGHL